MTHERRFHIVSEEGHRLHKRRWVWQWFYDSANPGWKTRGGAERRLAQLRKYYPEIFDTARVEGD